MPDQDNQKRLQDETTKEFDNDNPPADTQPHPLEGGSSTVRSPNVVEETDRVPTAPDSQANFAGNETPNPPATKERATSPEIVTEQRPQNLREVADRIQNAASRLTQAVASGNVTRQLMDEVNEELRKVDIDVKHLIPDEGGVTS